MVKTAQKVKNKWDSLNSITQKMVTVITSFGIIIGAFVGASNYIVGQLDEHIQGQISDLKSDISDVKLSTTRNELLMMMEHNPNNVVEIEKIAKYYFSTLKGDWYMSELYSKWCKQYGGDASLVIK